MKRDTAALTMMIDSPSYRKDTKTTSKTAAEECKGADSNVCSRETREIHLQLV